MVSGNDEINVYLMSIATNTKVGSTILTCRLEQGRPISLGRGKENDLNLDDKRISRKHALIVWEKDGFVLTDFKSRNGTYLNGKRVSSATIEHGDRIKIGPYEFQVQRISKHEMMRKVMIEKMESPSQTGFFGDLSSLTIDEIVQIINQSQKTGLLTIQSNQVVKGPAQLYFQDGNIIDARINAQIGTEAAYTILQMTAGQFEFVIGETTSNKTIRDSTMHLLFEAVRLKDEQNR
ncbi:DUF4388 domain-containing protein [bacterium]|nr:DUF4388 domain-containing protein [bacterium]